MGPQRMPEGRGVAGGVHAFFVFPTAAGPTFPARGTDFAVHGPTVADGARAGNTTESIGAFRCRYALRGRRRLSRASFRWAAFTASEKRDGHEQHPRHGDDSSRS